MARDDYESVADLYDSVTLYQERPDTAFYVEVARECGGPVLELGCGTGRVLVPTARAGLDITGLDFSPHMLDMCRAQLARETDDVRARVTLVHGDMRSFDLGRQFALITIPFRPFQHLITVEDQLATLECIQRHLAPGGRLVFDVFNPSLDALVNRPVDTELPEGPPFVTPDGRKVERTSKTVLRDPFAQVSLVELIYYVTYPDNHRERIVHAFAMRYAFRFEMEHLLARAGFVVEHLYAGFEKSAYGSTYPGELVFVARTAGLNG